MILKVLLLIISLTSLGTIAGFRADPGADSTNLSIHRWVVGTASRYTPGGYTIDGGSNREGTTRVTLKIQNDTFVKRIFNRILDI